MFTRRKFLLCAGSGAGAMLVGPRIAFASVESERRFVFVIQRGAADGLDTVIPYADPGYARLHGEMAVDAADTIKLDGTFALHPSLAQIAAMFAAGHALFVQAVASPYRDRSHFDGQNVLETGGSLPYQTKDGWLNRLAGMLPPARAQPIAFAPTVPLALRGHIQATSYAPSALPWAPDDLLSRVSRLYADDPQLHGLWATAMQTHGLATDTGARQDPASLGKLAASFLGRDDGPRIAMIETAGWDTHTGQKPRLAARLAALDAMIGALKEGLGTHWSRTTVLVATEFGRTAAVNGTGGTDHGTASAAMLLGGAVQGGRVLVDWPGLAPSALYQGRDLRPTLGLDSLIASAAGETFGLDPAMAGSRLFAQGQAAPMRVKLLRA